MDGIVGVPANGSNSKQCSSTREYHETEYKGQKPHFWLESSWDGIWEVKDGGIVLIINGESENNIVGCVEVKPEKVKTSWNKGGYVGLKVGSGISGDGGKCTNGDVDYGWRGNTWDVNNCPKIGGSSGKKCLGWKNKNPTTTVPDKFDGKEVNFSDLTWVITKINYRDNFFNYHII